MREVLTDLRRAARDLGRSPGFALVAIGALALGIGASVSVFSVLDAVLLRPLPFPEPDRLVEVSERHGTDPADLKLTYATFLDLRRGTTALGDLAAWRPWFFNLEGEQPERLRAALVTPGFFATLGMSPARGRGFEPEEALSGRDDVAVLSHGLWVRRFGGDPGILGRRVATDQGALTVVGVMPPGFDFPRDVEVWSTLTTDGALASNRRSHLLSVLGRLQGSARLDGARAELAAAAERIESSSGAVDPQLALTAARLKERQVGPFRGALVMLFGGVALVLAIACADVAGLLLVRGAHRERELAVRAALGAGRGRLARLLLAESLLIALPGAAVGLLLAAATRDALVALAPATLPGLERVALDPRAAGFGLALGLATGVLAGLAPILRLRGRRLEAALGGTRGATSARESRTGSALVVGQVAVALVLVAGSALLIRTLHRLAEVDPGFRVAGVERVPLFLPAGADAAAEEGARQTAFFEPLLARLRTLPGVEAAGLANVAPFEGGPETTYEPAEQSDAGAPERAAAIRIVDTAALEVLGVPLLRGRGFDTRDRAGAPAVMLVNRTLAERHWPGGDAIGQRVTMKDWGPPLTGTIVGVVGDARLDGLDRPAPPTIYWPYAQFPTRFHNLLLRTDRPAAELLPEVRRAVWALAPSQPVADGESLAALAADALGQRRFAARLLTAFALAALLLAALGLYGVVAWTVARRTRELGVRAAVGARRADLVRLVLGRGLRLSLLGAGIGLVAAVALSGAVAHLLFGVAPRDPLSLGAAAAVLVATALAACALPAWRAARVDPVQALRAE